MSVILPVFQGEGFVRQSVTHMLDALGTQGCTFELLVVDDGSTDRTGEQLRALAAAQDDPRLRLARLPINSGKGRAVRHGMALATGRFRLYTDADLAYPPGNLAAVLDALRDGADVVVASRCHRASRYEREIGPLRVALRRGLGWLFRAFTLLLGLGRMEDSQAGLKGFSAAACERLFPRLRIDRYAFDVELLLTARRLGLRVVEVPVVFVYQAGRDTGRLLVDGWAMLRDLMRIRWLAWRRLEDAPPRARPASREALPGSASAAAKSATAAEPTTASAAAGAATIERHATQDPAPPRARSHAVTAPALLVLASLIALFLGLRLAILLLAFDDVFTPGYELWPVGTTANQIRLGLPALPLFEFHDTHSGGQILSALLTAASFAWLGTSAFALKLVPIGFALLTLIVTYLGVLRLAGRGPALLAGLLLVFAPPAFVDYTSANYGNHGEVVLFVALLLASFVPVLRAGGEHGDRGDRGDRGERGERGERGKHGKHGKHGKRGERGWPMLRFGLCCGLAVWYALSSLLVLVIALPLWWCVRGAFFLRRGFVAWIAGLLAGLSPGLYLLLHYDAPQAEWLVAKFVERRKQGELGPLGRFVAFFTDLLPDSACSYALGPLDGAWIDRGFATLWISALVVLTLRWHRSRSRCTRRLLAPAGTRLAAPRDARVGLLAYPLVLALAYACSDFLVGNWPATRWAGYRYFMTLFYVLALVQVALFVELRDLRPRLARALAACGVALGIAGNLGHHFDGDARGDALRVSGVNDFKISRLFLQERWIDDTERIVATAEGFSRDTRAEVYRGLGFHHAMITLREDGRRGTAQFDPMAVVQRFPARYAVFVARGVGTAVAEHQTLVGQHDAAERGLLAVQRSPFPWAESMAQGLSLTSEPVVPSLDDERLLAAGTLVGSLRADLRVAGAEGLGHRVGEAFWRGLARDRQVLVRLLPALAPGDGSPALRGALLRGIGHSAPPERTAHDPAGEALAALIAPDELPWLVEGIGWRDAEQSHDAPLEPPPGLPPALADAWQRGVERAAALAAPRAQVPESPDGTAAGVNHSAASPQPDGTIAPASTDTADAAVDATATHAADADGSDITDADNTTGDASATEPAGSSDADIAGGWQR